MRRLHILMRSSLLILMLAVSVFAGGPTNYIVTLKTGTTLPPVAPQLSGWTKAVLGSGAFLVQIPPGPVGAAVLAALNASPLVATVEADGPVGLPKTPGPAPSAPPSSVSNLPTCPTNTNFSIPGPVGGPAGSAAGLYLAQKPNCIVQLPASQTTMAGKLPLMPYGKPGVMVAVIDTGVDNTHPVLAGHVILGQDFTGSNDPTGTLAQETSPMVDQETSPMVDQETSPMVDSASTVILNQETSPMVDQETSPMVDAHGGKLPSALGHGTMVAGIIHLTAPGVTILSLKAFNNNGYASISTIYQALMAAAMNPSVQVINASWSTTTDSTTLRNAVAFAVAAGKVIVAAVANNGNAQPVYPAAYNGVISVACTDDNNTRCSFSNFGTYLDLAAPGSGITSTFPLAYSKSGYATGWGTSFSAPYVSGAAALVLSLNSGALNGAVTTDVEKSPSPATGFGTPSVGVLNVNGAIN
jgi:Subtilase family